MLDKSVPYAGVYMIRDPDCGLPAFRLPDGFRFAFYADGCEKDWSRIETSVLEFQSEFSALMYFLGKFMPDKDELFDRCLFIEESDGKKIGTATAWWDVVDGIRRPWLHWVAVMPEYQGLGLGKALISRVTELMLALEGRVPFYLHTQTWSHKAIEIYKLMGYNITKERKLYRSTKDNYRKAARILERIRKEKR